MPLSVFEKQLAFLRRHREIISIDHLWECIVNRRRLESRQVVLTFDDGYKNNLHVVAPLLKGWNIPFSIFVSTKHIDQHCRFPMYYMRTAALYTQKNCIHLQSIQRTFDLTSREKRLAAAKAIVEASKRAPLDLVERITEECINQLATDWAELNARFSSDEPMTWDDVLRVASMGATIGSHCHDHCILHSNQSRAEVHRQVNESKKAIETRISTCKYFAYPNGTPDDISYVAYGAASSAGYRMALSTILGEITGDTDCFFAPRIFAVPEYEEFCYLMNRSSRQNEVYRLARLRSGLAGSCSTFSLN